MGKNERENIKNGNVIGKENDQQVKIGKFRRILPQILASSAKNLLLLDLGLSAAFPTILIPALRGILTNVDHSEVIQLSAEQATWLASIPYICQPIGSVFSGSLTDPIGRKKAMIIVNIPHIIAWLMLHFATTLHEVFIAVVLLGLGVGFMEAPIVTYVGEICEPSIRGILTAFAGVSVMIGVTIIFFLGTVVQWRVAALICLSVPITTMIAICFVPETPMWLLSKNKKEDALKSLQWLRGWVSPNAVAKEFDEISRYSENSNKCIQCQKNNVDCNHPPANLKEKLKELIRKRTLKPFFLLLIYFVILQFSGIHAMRPYLVQIFKAYRVNMDPGQATVFIGFIGIIANIICMGCIKFIGKRKLSIFSIGGITISCISLGIYAFNNLPRNLSSFNIPTYEYAQPSSIPLILFFLLGFFTMIGISPVPWILLSEFFPFKSRGYATGITAALNYILIFISTKIYLSLENHLTLSGVIWLYGGISALGLIFIYFMLPETENRTLEDIENHFSDNSRKITDIKIEKITKIKNNEIWNQKNNNQLNLASENENSTYKINYRTGCDNHSYLENER